MSKLKEIQRQSTVSWSPIADYPDYMAVGTVAGTISADFDTTSKLEIYSLDITNNESKQMALKGVTSANTRFNKVVWGQSSSNFPNGIIAGAMDNGNINLYNPTKILENSDDALIGIGQKHTGPVQSIDFNCQNPNLLASGGSDSEVYIWDLNDATQPSAHTPGSKSQQSSDITCVAWNKKVPHILGSSSYNGYIVISDLKSKKTLMTFNDRNRRCKYRTIVWHPNEATQIVAASEDDDYPIVQSWDLRNTSTPFKSFEGHKKGVWGLSWSPNDPALLLSCGKDNRTICWNYDRQEVLCDIDHQSNSNGNEWNFEVQWSPRVPALLATSSFVGKVNVYSLQDVNEKNVAPQINSLGLQEPTTQPTYKHTPNWLLRPCGASFGFGGKLAVFGKPSKKLGASSPQTSPQASVERQSRIVHISHVTTEKEIVKSSEELERVISTGQYEQYCEEKIQQSTNEEEKSIWSFLKVKFAQDDRFKILDYLGYDIETIKKELSQFLGTLPELPIEKKEPTSTTTTTTEGSTPDESNDNSGDQSSLFPNTGDDDFAKNIANGLTLNGDDSSSVTSTESKTPIEFPVDEKEQMITKALLVGDHQAAVDCCLRLGRYSDALILAHSAGQEIWKKTQEAYFEIVKSPFGRVVSCIVKRDFNRLVRTADLSDWKASLAILCTYAAPSDFKNLSGILGDRLINETKDTKSAILCYICAGDIDKTVNIWTHRSNTNESKETIEESHQDLQNLIEKVSIFRSACGNNNSSLNVVLSMKYAKYAEILASQGNLSGSLRYLSHINNPECQQACGVLYDRVYRATSNHQGIRPPPFPFQLCEVRPSNKPQQPQQQPQQQQPQQQELFGQFNSNAKRAPNMQPLFTNQQQQQPPHMMPMNQQQQQIPSQPQPSLFKTMGNQPPMMMNQGPTTNFNQPPTNFNQPPPMMMNQGPPPTGGFNQPPQNLSKPPSFNQPPPMMNQGPPPTNFNQPPPMMMNQGPPPTGGFNQPPPMINQGPPPTNNFNQPPPMMNQGPPTNIFNQPPPSNQISPPPQMNQGPPMIPSPMGNTNQPPMMPMIPNPTQPPQQLSPPPIMSSNATPSSVRSPILEKSNAPGSPNEFSVAPKPNVHNKTPSISAEGSPVQEPTTEEINSFIERLTQSIQSLNGKSDSKVWDDVNKRCQTLINKVSKKDISGGAFRALEHILSSIVERDFKKASDTYIQITSTGYWAEIGSQPMVGLKRLIDLGLKQN
ncbi:hypothetical protein DICPUDRAFT_152246 [Dictyostelium purpureum]|uniref:Protein transport protein SEC31 n=1 Tax=Dictyostelium purpureum TaxID=5786 RepID=F0ZKV1_DICPU|nr:uncharacterized protein DICPUDRAFT_152246 [Dictyostelium purpureum]EGC35441.1 hypothetical protein DICPUDRAFT_152246 [Dictyostelium purpureum]|eukprot:XP_003288054.1 hypothetical protein DICPUDRAFT_152246 [Dictyostelium purpureum]